MSKANNRTDQASGLRNLSRSKPIKVIAIAAGKGGVGKSNISVNLAIALAQRNKKVMLMDADLGLANVDILLGMHSKYNLSHVIKGRCQLHDILLQGPEGIQVIPASSGSDYMTQLSASEHAGIIDAFNELTDEFDYMIIDTAAGISDTVLSFARSSQELVVIVRDEPTSLTDAYAFIKVMTKRYEWSHFHVLANMVPNPKEGRELFNKLYRVAEHFLDVRLDYMGAIPFDNCVHEAIKKQKPVVLSYPGSSAAKAFLQLAEIVEEWPPKYALGGNTSFFLERLVAREY
ncbi:MinD/ParA family protein [Legionella jordanis]|uniref:Flagellar biosynthesis MinD n=1 Tax=Legionella jordanis TaxID=456 RepID=A0A0W0V8N3_9GAMM|nr:MinD/ParA family protein [Legionella jordanis]KTD16499.1 flagellar biosynthesis MinD [Legionella jordanis]RMX03954.1 MinD/ParA family protein [Legionella jordanis]RMX21977.1 MinD/ParA family protein [Legionella jordanis]VEH12040.1 flagellar biosynthesis MinD [Legionella jordanis]HAT8712658.1 P-loop NTPase [Legionella jordanis]